MRFDLEFFDNEWNRNPDGLNFHGFCAVEVGTASAVVAKLWLRMNADRGSMKYTLWGNVNEKVGLWRHDGDTSDSKHVDYLEILEPKTRQIHVAGRRSDKYTLVMFQLLPLGK